MTIDEALRKGIEAHKAGQAQEADRLYTAILQSQPNHPDANHNMGVLAVGVGKAQEALPFFKIALDANPNVTQFWLSYIDALLKLGLIAVAKQSLNQAKENVVQGEGLVQLQRKVDELDDPAKNLDLGASAKSHTKPNILDSLTLDQATKLARKKLKGGFPQEAKSLYKDILTRFPKNKKANEGIKALSGKDAASSFQDPLQEQLLPLIDLHSRGLLVQLLSETSQLQQRFPDSAILHNILGAANAGLGDFDTAISNYKKAVSIKPDFADAFNNMGVALNEKNYFEAAIESYKQALKIIPDFAGAYYNMANTLKDSGDPEAAIEAYKQALKFRPDHADTYNNMGNALRSQGALKAALESYRHALKIEPNNAHIYNNIGAATEVDNPEGAIENYKKALRIKPDFADAYNNMGNALMDKRDPEASINSYKQALKIKPDFVEANYNLGNALSGIVFSKPIPDLQRMIVLLLTNKNYVRPVDISKAAISLLKFDPVIKELFQKHAAGQLTNSFDMLNSTLTEVPLLTELMRICPLPDLALEAVFTDTRSALLSAISQITDSPQILHLQTTLALQCFINEYIYDQSDIETELLGKLELSIVKDVSSGKQPSPHSLLCLASYKALHSCEWADLIIKTTDIEAIFIQQVLEPKQENQLKSQLPILNEITDKISSKVRKQYEESPYPRWVKLGLPLSSLSLPKVVDELNLKIYDNNFSQIESPTILIAGCGTGQHSIGTAAKFLNSKVLAVDLSLASLAYAKRKTKELGFQNIEYMQADILDLGKLNRQFDLVESSGVLHHMNDPMAGWRVLTDCLKPGGLMNIGLYSELARKHIVTMREEISQSGIGASEAAMKLFRNSAVNSSKEHHNKILESSNFYSLSELRDLLFHVQEHQFTLTQIQNCLDDLGLKFCGFGSNKIVKEFKLTNSAPGDPYNLQKWQYYEESNPRCFSGMYQFWCQKLG